MDFFLKKGIELEYHLCHIPNTIEFVGKTPKINDKWEVCKQHLVKPLAWPCKQWTSKYHQVPCHSFRNHGGLNIVMECGHIPKNVKDGLCMNVKPDLGA